MEKTQQLNELSAAFNNFNNAAAILLAKWQSCRQYFEGDEFNNKFPFPYSFDEATFDIDEWVTASISEIEATKQS